MLRMGLIRPGMSEWSSPVVLVPKIEPAELFFFSMLSTTLILFCSFRTLIFQLCTLRLQLKKMCGIFSPPPIFFFFLVGRTVTDVAYPLRRTFVHLVYATILFEGGVEFSPTQVGSLERNVGRCPSRSYRLCCPRKVTYFLCYFCYCKLSFVN